MAQKYAQSYVGIGRRIAVAVFKTERRHPDRDDHPQIPGLAAEGGRYHKYRQDGHGCVSIGVKHWRQVNEGLDRADPKSLPKSLIVEAYILCRRARLQADANATQIFQAYLERPVALIQTGVQDHTQ